MIVLGFAWFRMLGRCYIRRLRHDGRWGRWGLRPWGSEGEFAVHSRTNCMSIQVTIGNHINIQGLALCLQEDVTRRYEMRGDEEGTYSIILSRWRSQIGVRSNVGESLRTPLERHGTWRINYNETSVKDRYAVRFWKLLCLQSTRSPVSEPKRLVCAIKDAVRESVIKHNVYRGIAISQLIMYVNPHGHRDWFKNYPIITNIDRHCLALLNRYELPITQVHTASNHNSEPLAS
jgi:hypothetical protein